MRVKQGNVRRGPAKALIGVPSRTMGKLDRDFAIVRQGWIGPPGRGEIDRREIRDHEDLRDILVNHVGWGHGPAVVLYL